MNIDDLTIGEAKKLAEMFRGQAAANRSDDCWELGKNYLIRTVTMTLTGKLIAVGDKELGLKEAAWIADTGRFANSLVSCEFSEVEPYPADRVVIVGRGAIIDAVQIDKLPREQK